MPIHQTARTFGARRVPTFTAASGCWQLGEVTQARRAGIWPKSGDLYFDQVELLLPMDGTNGSTTFTDESSNGFTVTANGNAQISTSESKFGGASAYFDGTGDYLTIPSNAAFAFGTGDFTVEFWFFTTNTSTRQDPFSVYTTTSGFGIGLSYDDLTDVVVYAGNTVLANTAGSKWSGSTWNHIAVSRSGTSLKTFINGSEISSVTNSTNITVTSDLHIGIAGNLFLPYTGYIDDLRVTKGVARYTANFTPPATAHPIS